MFARANIAEINRYSLKRQQPMLAQQGFLEMASKRVVKEHESPRNKLSLLNHYVQSLCGLYSRIARRFQVDRSYVSRVVRGERHSAQIERALADEFEHIMNQE